MTFARDYKPGSVVYFRDGSVTSVGKVLNHYGDVRSLRRPYIAANPSPCWQTPEEYAHLVSSGVIKVRPTLVRK